MKISNISHDYSSTLSMVGGFVALLIIIQTARLLYVAFVGPLSKFPGPRLAKVSRLPFVWHGLRGDGHTWLLDLHAKYGDIVQEAPGQLSFASGHAWKDIYGHSVGGKTQQFPKDAKFYGNRPPGVYDLIYSNDADHTRQRRNFSHAFSDRALREQEPLIRQYVDQLVVKLGERIGQKLDLVKWYNYTTFDIMADLTFGESLGNLSSGGYHPWVTMVFSSIKVANFMTEMKHFPLFAPLISMLVPKSEKEKRAKHWQLAAEQVDKRLAKDNARPDIWGTVLKAKEEQQLTVPEMHVNSQLLMLAGTETTATLLSGLTFLLLSNPEKMEMVKKEVREKFNSADEINIDSVLQLKYINACFEEALRCYPPVPTGLPRNIPKGGDLVCGQPIPEGTRVSVHQLATYRNPNNFHRASEFLPERWLGDPEFERDQRAALQPFSYGPRNCIGKNLAYLEMRLIFANIIWHYDISICDDATNWNNQKTYRLWEKNQLNVTLQPVLREKKELLA